ncbi:peptidoglycan-binding domain-containing protein [Streptomyces pakalii]|uniref:Peptidoglycan-binding domain-containing protein n=1 Tax=Streptomyces pakalii TaxID=3036494 RepID=A0ABT7D5D6_9ACTN|nr:peptidoglycan-binding domain-containing protein [Streptomyces pakalii]MDJ1641011.1 peptidoglycan-binding domain-containing protein [Streptomyces pakalii]
MPCRCGAGAGSAPLTQDEQRAARTAEIAAAEDFDPLRIRPYVTLTAEQTGAGADRTGAGEASRTAEGTQPGTWAGEASGMPEGTQPGAWAGKASGAERREADVPGAAATTMPLFLSGDGPDAGTGTGATPGAGAATGAYAAAGGNGDRNRRRTAAASPAFAPDPVQPRRRRPFGALAVGAAAAAVVGTAAFAGGLFGGDDGGDEALPEATTSVPDTDGEPAASVAPSPSASAAPSRTPSHSAAPSASPSASASPTRSREPSPTATASASQTASASPTPEDGGAPTSSPSAAPPAEFAGASLRPGDRGPEVGVLQNRLREVWLYSGPSDQNYSERVENAVAIYQSYKAIQGDPMGVYGPNTRRALEAETTGSGHR